MSRLFPERVLVVLAPGRIAVGARAIACDPAYGAEPWQGAVAALRAVEWNESARVTMVLSNHFVRYALVPWSEALSTAAEEAAYVRHHFARIHGERAKGWTLRASPGAPAEPRLCSAIDVGLLEAIKTCFEDKKAKLVSLQPGLMAAFNRWRESIPAAGAWLVVAEPGRACVALHSGRRWRSVQNARGSWRELLERERRRVDGEVPDRVLQMEGVFA